MATSPISIHSAFVFQLKTWSLANVRAKDCPKTLASASPIYFRTQLPPDLGPCLLMHCPKTLGWMDGYRFFTST